MRGAVAKRVRKVARVVRDVLDWPHAYADRWAEAEAMWGTGQWDPSGVG